MFEGMKKSEIKKAEAAANRYFGRKDCKVTGYFARPALDSTPGLEWYDIECEICFGYGGERAPHDVLVFAAMYDRRRSFATVKTWK